MNFFDYLENVDKNVFVIRFVDETFLHIRIHTFYHRHDYEGACLNHRFD